MYNKEYVKALKAQNLTVFEEVYQLRLEVVQGCNLNCWHCGRTRQEHKLMSMDTFSKIMHDVTPRCKRVEFAAQGEATLHPELCNFVMLTRKVLPGAQISTYTNSVSLRQTWGMKYLIDLFDAGMNVIQVDLYSKDQLDWFNSEIGKVDWSGIEVVDFYSDNQDPWRFKSAKDKRLIICNETSGFNSGKRLTRKPHNFGGNLEYRFWDKLAGLKITDFPLERVCTEPLKYMTIGASGDVYLCCTDGAHAVVVGNVMDENMQDIWQGENFQALRLILKLGHRKYIAPCSLCNCMSYRIGLYPYWGPEIDTETISRVLLDVHRLNKNEPLVTNLMQLSNDTGQLKDHLVYLVKEAIRK